MTLASAALGPALPSEEVTNKDVSPPPPHLIMPVDLRKGLGGERYYPYLALGDSGATYNFIAQSVTDKLILEVVKAGRSKVKKKASPPSTTVNGEPLRATTVVQQTVKMRDSAGTKPSHVINFLVANIAHFDMILGMAGSRRKMLISTGILGYGTGVLAPKRKIDQYVWSQQAHLLLLCSLSVRVATSCTSTS